MSATRTCPRCKTANDLARSTCQSCGGVMLGVGGAFAGSPVETADAVRTSAVEPTAAQTVLNGKPGGDIAAAVREKLAHAQNLTPEKRALIEQLLAKQAEFATRQPPPTAAPPSPRKAAWPLVLVLLLAAAGVAIYASLRVPPPPPVPLPTIRAPSPLPPEVTAQLAQAQAQLAAARAQVAQVAPVADPQPPAKPPEHTLTRAELRPLRSCFRDRGVPSERPMHFGIALERQAGKLDVNVFAMTDVEVPPPVAECLRRHVPAQGWSLGLYFAEWPVDPNWP